MAKLEKNNQLCPECWSEITFKQQDGQWKCAECKSNFEKPRIVKPIKK